MDITTIPDDVLDYVIANRQGGMVQLRVMRAVINREFARQLKSNGEAVQRHKAERQRRRKVKGRR